MKQSYRESVERITCGIIIRIVGLTANGDDLRFAEMTRKV